MKNITVWMRYGFRKRRLRLRGTADMMTTAGTTMIIIMTIITVTITTMITAMSISHYN